MFLYPFWRALLKSHIPLLARSGIIFLIFLIASCNNIKLPCLSEEPILENRSKPVLVPLLAVCFWEESCTGDTK